MREQRFRFGSEQERASRAGVAERTQTQAIAREHQPLVSSIEDCESEIPVQVFDKRVTVAVVSCQQEIAIVAVRGNTWIVREAADQLVPVVDASIEDARGRFVRRSATIQSARAGRRVALAAEPDRSVYPGLNVSCISGTDLSDASTEDLNVNRP
jgi:hypothetical protein